MSNHPDHVKRGLIRSLHTHANNICSNKTLLDNEVKNIFNDLRYSSEYIRSCLVKKHPKMSDREVRGSLVIPYVWGVSKKIRRIAASFDLRTAFHSRLILERLLCSKTPSLEMLDKKNIIYNIPCECGKVYLGETCRSLRVRLYEHKKNVKRGSNTAGSKLAEHVWEEQHRILWDQVGIVASEGKMFGRRFKESVFILLNNDCISQVSMEVPGIWAWTVRRYVNNLPIG